MNLYLFNDANNASTFGIGTYLNELTRALKGTGIHIHMVHLHAACQEFVIRPSSRTDQVENWYIPEIQNQNTFDGPIRDVENYFRNVIYLLRIHIKDTTNLVFHFNYNLCHVLAKGLRDAFSCKTVTTVHFIKWALELQGNLQKLHALKSKPESQRNSFEELLYTTDEYESLLYQEVDRVIVLSQHNKDILCNEYQINPEKIAIIPNGLVDNHAGQTFDKAAIRRKWHIAENERLIIFAGRLQTAKGTLILIDTFRKVLEKMPDSRLLIAGSGDFESCIRVSKGISAKVTFTGLLEKDELHELYQIADVGVLPSFFETFGYVAVEMMMHGLPVVVTATSGLDEVVDEASGLKVPITEYSDRVKIDTDLLAEKIVYLLEHPEEAKRLGENGRKRYLENYTGDIFRRNMIRLYESLYKDNHE